MRTPKGTALPPSALVYQDFKEIVFGGLRGGRFSRMEFCARAAARVMGFFAAMIYYGIICEYVSELHRNGWRLEPRGFERAFSAVLGALFVAIILLAVAYLCLFVSPILDGVDEIRDAIDAIRAMLRRQARKSNSIWRLWVLEKKYKPLFTASILKVPIPEPLRTTNAWVFILSGVGVAPRPAVSLAA